MSGVSRPTSISSVTTSLSAITNNPFLNASIPPTIIRSTGNDPIYLPVDLNDGEGNMEDPTNNEINIRIVAGGGLSSAAIYKENACSNLLDAPTDTTTFPAASGWGAMERTATGRYECYLNTGFGFTIGDYYIEIGYTENSINKFSRYPVYITDEVTDAELTEALDMDVIDSVGDNQDITSELTMSTMDVTASGLHRLFLQLVDINQTGAGCTITIRVWTTIDGVTYEIYSETVDVSIMATSLAKLSSFFWIDATPATITVKLTSDDAADTTVDITARLLQGPR